MSGIVNISSRASKPPAAPGTSPPTGRQAAAPAGEMHGHGTGAPKDIWVHNIEATASLAIALGTLIELCNAHGLIPASPASQWLLECLIPFQLPIFYFCLGFLYQRHRTTRTRLTWELNLKRELALMGIPFVAFTVLVLLANSLTGADAPLTPGNLAEALLVRPVAPVGYFYTCLIIYAITPTVKSRRNACGLLLAAASAKVLIVTLASLPATTSLSAALPYAVTSVAENWIWVAGGMAMALFRGLPLVRGSEKTWALAALWLTTSTITFYAGWVGEASLAVLDALGLLCAISLFSTVFRSGRQNRFYGFITRYTMAIWLFHGLCLTLYFHLWAVVGTDAPAAIPIAGVGAALACYAVPILLMKVLSRIGSAGIIVYPARYLPPAPAAMLRKTPH